MAFLVWLGLGVAAVCAFSVRQVICMFLACPAALLVGIIFCNMIELIDPSGGDKAIRRLWWSLIVGALSYPIIWRLISWKIIPYKFCRTIPLKGRLLASCAIFILFVAFYLYIEQ